MPRKVQISGIDGRRLGLFARDLFRADPSRGVRPLLLALAGAAAEGVGLVLLVPIIAVLGGGPDGIQPASGWMTSRLVAYLPAGKPAQLTVLVALFCALMVVRAAITIARDISFARLNAAFPERVRGQVLDRLVAAGWSRIAGLHHARITHLLSADFQTCAVAGISFINLCLSGIMLVVLLTVALVISPLLAVTGLLFLTALAAILFPTLRSARRTGTVLAELGVLLTNDLGQFLAGLKPALGNNLGKEFLAHIAQLQRAQAHHMVQFARQQSGSRAGIALGGGAVAALALLVGGLALHIEGPRLLAMLAVLARLHGPAQQFQQNIQLLLHTLPTYERIKALEEDLRPTGEAAANVPTMTFPRGEVTLERVTYLHAGGDERSGGVRELDLVLEPGSRVAIIGASGAGKTTLADLLAGLIPPQSGAIRIAGEMLAPENAGQWQNRIAYVPQDSFLLNDTIRNNLVWGTGKVDDKDLHAALQIAAADSFIDSRALGLEAQVGERGILLSGGERQRIALARALLRRPRLIILDEATNALDTETEQRVLASLATLPDQPTVVVIAHRSAALDSFDLVYQMAGGRLLSIGDDAG